MYHNKNFKSDIKSYRNVIKTELNDSDIPLETTIMVHAIILIDSIFKKVKNYYTLSIKNFKKIHN